MAEDTSERATPAKQVIALIKAKNTAHTRVQSINGEIGERLRHAKDNAHLNLQAFGLISKLARMDEEKRNDFLRAFDLYRDYAEEANLFGEEHVGDLLDGAKGEDDSDPDADASSANVVALERGIKALSDEEREFDDQTSSKPSRRRQKEALDGADAPGTYKVIN
jgi:hypothetical protein